MIVISNSAFDTTPWQAGLVGLISGLFFSIGIWFIKSTRIDDALQVTGTFLIPGILGGILPGFLSDADGVFWQGKSGITLGTQVIGVIVVLGWSLTWAVIIFGSLKVFKKLALDREIQVHGLDGLEIRQTGYKLSQEVKNKE